MRRTFYVAVVTLLLALASAGPGLAGGLPAVPVVGSGQENEADQGQVQVVPVAPQVNVQNVNVATFDEVEQGDAGNANTGQAVQQENTQVGLGDSSGGGASHAGGQENEADQGQVQVVPVAPQVNVQNVNVATFDEVEQGDAGNANTGQAVQQENTQAGHGGTPRSEPKPHPKPCESKCEPRPKPEPKPCESTCKPKHGHGLKHDAGQRNEAEQKQLQIVPIAPQANLQNVNVLTFGEVEQGNAANANTGQAVQQENTQVRSGGTHHPRSEPKPCPPRYEPKPCPPKHEPKPCPPRCEPKPCEANGSRPAHGGGREIPPPGVEGVMTA
jgi:hypothetical protein